MYFAFCSSRVPLSSRPWSINPKQHVRMANPFLGITPSHAGSLNSGCYCRGGIHKQGPKLPHPERQPAVAAGSCCGGRSGQRAAPACWCGRCRMPAALAPPTCTMQRAAANCRCAVPKLQLSHLNFAPGQYRAVTLASHSFVQGKSSKEPTASGLHARSCHAMLSPSRAQTTRHGGQQQVVQV